jgi:hypothetical protein
VKPIDVTTMRPDEGILVAAAIAITEGLHPAMLHVHPKDYTNIELSLNYRHEYLDEETRSYLVLRVPERLPVRTDLACVQGKAKLVCRSPDVDVEV